MISVKIIYGICGEGMGHATRSRPIIEFLKQNHTVTIVAGGKAFDYLKNFFPTRKIASMHLFYRNNAMNSFVTVLLNLARLHLYLFSFAKMLCVMMKERPDVVVTDFEPFCCWSAFFARVPIVSVHLPGHYVPRQSLLVDKTVSDSISSVLKHRWLDVFQLWFVTQITVPFAAAVVIPSFFVLPLSDKRAHYIAPIVRLEISSCIAKKGRHILVYQSTATNSSLLKVLKNFPVQKFVVYGFGENRVEQNIIFKNFDEHEFITDLVSASGVISNGGVSLLTECVFLGKPVLSLPIQCQGEQIVNAFFVQKLGYGIFARQASDVVVLQFLKFVEKFKPKKVSWNSEASLMQIEEIVKSVVG